MKKTSLKIYDSSATQVELLAWGDVGDALLDLQEHELVLFSNLSVNKFRSSYHLKFDGFSRIFKDTNQVETTLINSLLKFRNERKNNPDSIKINDISEITLSTSKAVLYMIEEIKRDAEDRILSLREDKVVYNTFAYFDTISLKRNVTWKREGEHEDKRIFLANAKFSDQSGVIWVTLCSGGDVVLGMSPSEAHAKQENEKGLEEEGENTG